VIGAQVAKKLLGVLQSQAKFARHRCPSVAAIPRVLKGMAISSDQKPSPTNVAEVQSPFQAAFCRSPS
jgi:hypothetical protein